MTLQELLNSLIDTHEVTGAFDDSGILTDVYFSPKAEREITSWYIEDGDLIGEATAGHEKMITEFWREGNAHGLGLVVADILKKEAMAWLHKSDEWSNVQSGLQADYEAGQELMAESYKDNIFRALDPTS